jgi:hypothetical protein
MGQTIPCACFEHVNLADLDGEDKAVNERLKMLKDGGKFSRKAYLGLTSQDVLLNLSEDNSAIKWKTENTWTNAENGEIDLTSQVKKVKTIGESGMQYIGLDDKVIFEVKHEDPAVRDKWIIALNELLQSWIDNPESKPKSSVSAGGSSNKSDYFRRREDEIKAREKANNEKKAKYASGGMAFTAQIMAERSN